MVLPLYFGVYSEGILSRVVVCFCLKYTQWFRCLHMGFVVDSEGFYFLPALEAALIWQLSLQLTQ